MSERDVIEKKTIGDYEIKIFPDEDPESPREWDNLGTMVCFHRRYNLGDKHEYNSNDFDSWGELEARIIRDHDVAVILPLYLFDHSGITMCTNSFGDPWDSGQVGFIYVSKKTVREAYNLKYVTKKVRERMAEYLKGEVETYDNYLTGNVYGYQITKGDEDIYSCWGYYELDECMKEAESVVEYSINEKKETI